MAGPQLIYVVLAEAEGLQAHLENCKVNGSPFIASFKCWRSRIRVDFDAAGSMRHVKLSTASGKAIILFSLLLCTSLLYFSHSIASFDVLMMIMITGVGLIRPRFHTANMVTDSVRFPSVYKSTPAQKQ